MPSGSDSNAGENGGHRSRERGRSQPDGAWLEGSGTSLCRGSGRDFLTQTPAPHVPAVGTRASRSSGRRAAALPWARWPGSTGQREQTA